MELGAIPKVKEKPKLSDSSGKEVMSLSESIESLPDEILEHILGLVSPYSDLENCSRVCRRWEACCSRVRSYQQQQFHAQVRRAQLIWSHQYSEDSAVNSVSKRYSHCAVYYPHRSCMFVFGGCTSTSSTFNDLWELNLSTRSWRRPLSMGAYPSPKACASMVLHEDTLVLFGGWTHPSLYPLHQSWKLFSELHVYFITENRWALVNSEQGERPPAMAGHSATVHNGTMVVFGGLHKQRSIGHYTSSNDLWTYDLSTQVWSLQLTGGEASPLPRYGQSQVYLDQDHLLVLGGCGGPNNEYTDIWLLKMSSNPWTWVEMEVRGSENRAKDIWCHPACKVGDKVVVLGKNRTSVVKQQQPSGTSQAWNVIPQLRRGLNRGQGAIRRPACVPAPHHRRAEASRLDSSDSDMELAVEPVPGPSRAGGGEAEDPLPRVCTFQVNNLGASPSTSSRPEDPSQATFRTTLSVNITPPTEKPTVRSSTLPPSNPIAAPNALIPVKVSPSHQKSFGPVANTGNQDPSVAGPRVPQVAAVEPGVTVGGPGNPERGPGSVPGLKNRQKLLENRQRQLASLQKMEEKIRNNSRPSTGASRGSDTSSPAVCPHHRMTTFLLDISTCISDHYVTWLVLPANSSLTAPQESILYSLVLGRTELVMFGGLQKDVSKSGGRGQQNNSEKVSNCLYYLNPPKTTI